MYLFSVHLYLSYRQLTNNTECVLILQWISVVVGGYCRTNTQQLRKKFMKMPWIGYEKGTLPRKNNSLLFNFQILSTAKRGENVLGCVHPSVRPLPLSLLNRLTYDLDIWYLGRPWPWLAWDCRSKVKVKCQESCFYHHCYIALRSRSRGQGHGSKVGVKVTVQGRGQAQRSESRSRVKGRGRGQGQRLGSRSKVKVKFLARSGRYYGFGFAECSKEQQPPLLPV